MLVRRGNDYSFATEELGPFAFAYCSQLKSMTIPNSLQKLGNYVFYNSSKLVPSIIDINDHNAVIAHLRSIQNP
ncbi:hypothetical protein TrLO_g14021 [Triparma laevis f. longispina]|uniref:Uncharacterized protein n=1 Tax=Triparma laevis f. longispina TaxID=1714387 RepID=A0A9W6ZHU4_9STRA|nr:hypothetical protein TrLO_g14021 [Triparma laevis f. longispina]